MPQLDIHTFLPQYFYFVIFFVISFLLVFTRILTSLTATSTTRHIERGCNLPKKQGVNLQYVTFGGFLCYIIALLALFLYAPMEILLGFYQVYHFLTYTLQKALLSFMQLVGLFLIDQFDNETLRNLVWYIRRELKQILILNDPQIITSAFFLVCILLTDTVVRLYPSFLQAHGAYVQEIQTAPFTQINSYFADTILSALAFVKSHKYFFIHQSAHLVIFLPAFLGFIFKEPATIAEILDNPELFRVHCQLIKREELELLDELVARQELVHRPELEFLETGASIEDPSYIPPIRVGNFFFRITPEVFRRILNAPRVPDFKFWSFDSIIQTQVYNFYKTERLKRYLKNSIKRQFYQKRTNSEPPKTPKMDYWDKKWPRN